MKTIEECAEELRQAKALLSMAQEVILQYNRVPQHFRASIVEKIDIFLGIKPARRERETTG